MRPSRRGGEPPSKGKGPETVAAVPGLDAALSKGNDAIVAQARDGAQGPGPAPLILAEYHGVPYQFTDAGWFNATEAARRFGKKPAEWMRSPETRRYLRALARSCKVEKSHFARTQRGGRAGEAGTWLHPKLAVQFARWLDIDFSVWADAQIDRLLRGHQAQQVATLFAQRLALETRDASSREKASIGSALMHDRRRQLPAIRDERAALDVAMQATLFAAEPAGSVA